MGGLNLCKDVKNKRLREPYEVNAKLNIVLIRYVTQGTFHVGQKR